MESVRSRTPRRIRATSGVSVRTAIPSRAGRWHEAGKPRWPSTSTRQVRQAPSGGRSGSLQSWGSGSPSRLTASRTLAPAGTSTPRPSTVRRMILLYAEGRREVLEGGPERQGRRLAEPAEGAELDDLGQLGEERAVGVPPRARGE